MSPKRSRRPRREQALAVLILPVVMFAVIFTGVIVLEHHAPRNEAAPELAIEGLPLPALGGEPTRCIRGTSDDRVGEVRAEVLPGSRVTSELVTACPAAFEGLELTYVGELVGHLLRRDGGAWVQVNDDEYALRTGPLPTHEEHSGTNTFLTVWLPDELTEDVTGLGGPGRRGDVVQLTGTVVRTDPEDGGGLTFRARRLEVLAASVEVSPPIHVPQAVAAGLLTLLAAVIGVGLRRSRRESR